MELEGMRRGHLHNFGPILNKWTYFPKYKKRVKIIKLLSIHLLFIKFKVTSNSWEHQKTKREDLGITGQSFPSIQLPLLSFNYQKMRNRKEKKKKSTLEDGISDLKRNNISQKKKKVHLSIQSDSFQHCLAKNAKCLEYEQKSMTFSFKVI